MRLRATQQHDGGRHRCRSSNDIEQLGDIQARQIVIGDDTIRLPGQEPQTNVGTAPCHGHVEACRLQHLPKLVPLPFTEVDQKHPLRIRQRRSLRRFFHSVEQARTKPRGCVPAACTKAVLPVPPQHEGGGNDNSAQHCRPSGSSSVIAEEPGWAHQRCTRHNASIEGAERRSLRNDGGTELRVARQDAHELHDSRRWVGAVKDQVVLEAIHDPVA